MRSTVTLVLLLVLCLMGCQKETPIKDYQTLDDQTLSSEISISPDKQTITLDELPAGTLRQVAEEFFDTYIESAAFVPEKGYEVTLASEDQVYFNLGGRRLVRKLVRLTGACGPLGGDIIPLDQLRPAIKQYVRENYPGVFIVRAKSRGDRIVVLLNNRTILVFSAAGVVEVNDAFWYDCRCGTASNIEFPTAVMGMLRVRFPDAKPERVCRRGDRIVVGAITSNGDRLVIVFDANWNFLFAHP